MQFSLHVPTSFAFFNLRMTQNKSCVPRAKEESFTHPFQKLSNYKQNKSDKKM